MSIEDISYDEYICGDCGQEECVCEEVEFEDDGQPTEYEEWQDYMGGDDWDHGQYDNDCDFGMEG